MTNRRTEEKLARLAFGEFTEVDAANAERDVRGNARAEAMLAEYRSMQEGLRSMGEDVPEDGLSPERLRHAILAAGLPARASGPSWGWIWAPLAAGIVAFSLVTLRTRPNSAEVQIVAQRTGQVDAGRIAFRQPGEAVAAVEPSLGATTRSVRVAKAIKPILVSPKVTTQGENPSAARSRKRRTHRVRPEQQPLAKPASPEDGLLASMVAPLPDSEPTIEKEPKADAAPVVEPTKLVEGSSTAVVIIEPDKDRETGAQRASEVSATNVVIGG